MNKPPAVVLYPGVPGDCFRSSFRFVVLNPDWWLCHGVAINTSHGMPMAHAWCELPRRDVTWVHHPSMFWLGLSTVTESYGEGNITHVVRYRLGPATRLADKFKHYGPWEPILWSVM